MPRPRRQHAQTPTSHTASPSWQGITAEIIGRFGVSPSDLAQYLGISLVSVVRWERSDTTPGPRMQARLIDVLQRP